MTGLFRWTPAIVMGITAVVTYGADPQQGIPLRAPLGSTVPTEIAPFTGRDLQISERQLRVAGATESLMRRYDDESVDQAGWFSLYVAYYDRQFRGKTIHSPRNCLPGTGWKALTSRTQTIRTWRGPVAVNRYLIQKGNQRALVLYWYQGRGRVQASEYMVKWDLLRDTALRHRSDEALVRIVVPIMESEDRALEIAVRAAEVVVPSLNAALPI